MDFNYVSVKSTYIIYNDRSLNKYEFQFYIYMSN